MKRLFSLSLALFLLTTLAWAADANVYFENSENYDAYKFLENDQVMIIRNGEKYNITGQRQ